MHELNDTFAKQWNDRQTNYNNTPPTVPPVRKNGWNITEWP